MDAGARLSRRERSSRAGRRDWVRGSDLSGEATPLTRSAAAAAARPLPSGEAGRTGLVFLGEFGRAHGLAGEVRLKSHTEDPRAIGRYGPLTSDAGRSYTLTSVRQAAGDQPDLLVVRVEGVTTREGAEALNRIRLHVPRESLGAPADEDEYFLSDLIGLAVEGPNGPLGHVVGVPDYGSGELLEIAPPDGGRSFLLPFTKRHVPVIDIAGGLIRADPPEGLIEPPRQEPDPSQPPEADAENAT
ncbi:ribosome maturation factor RimM [uncultured Enterovirga sp.]|uniref:ribosome maturation factor RimM n=1 Tax=uncultured Enterovirga sp. TaxID=2026352 RepID=UPI0035CC4B1D